MKIIGIIPARYDSSRFPGKALVDIMGKPMIQHVYERAITSPLLEKVIVATDDQRIYEEVESFDGQVMMTSAAHTNGTERCAEVVQQIKEKYDVVINIQGDEPLFDTSFIELLSIPFQNNHTQIATLVKEIHRMEELFEESVVKVVFDTNCQAKYFSRSVIPYLREADKAKWIKMHTFYKHIGIYAYRPDSLLSIAKLPAGKLEQAEKLEQLRWLENGYSITVNKTTKNSISIDTPKDLEYLLSHYRTELKYGTTI